MTGELTTAVRPLCAAGTAGVIRPRRDGYAYLRFRCRLGRAYPVFSNSYETARRTLETSAGTNSLSSVGRNGEFALVPMEAVYWRTQSPTHIGHLDRTGSA